MRATLNDLAPPPASSPIALLAARRRRRRRAFAVVLVGLVLVLLLAAAEIALRLWWVPPPPFGGLLVEPAFEEVEPGSSEPIAGFHGWFQEAPSADLPPSARFEPRVLEIRVNRLGLRGDELGDKAAAERRILFGGDSLTFGHAVDQDASFPARTAALLTAAARPVVACNAGVPGYGFAATGKRLRRLCDRVQADVLVAAYFLGNDATDDIDQRTTTVVAGRSFAGALGQLMRASWRARWCVHSRLQLWFETMLIARQPSWSLLAQMASPPEQAARLRMLPAQQLVGGLFLDAPPAHEFAPGAGAVVATWLADLEPTLSELRTTAGERPLLVVVLPTRYHVDPELRAKVLAEVGLDARLLTPGSATRQLLTLCERLRIPCLDATPVLATAPPAAMFQQDHTHLSVAGNELVARAVAERLRPLLR